jgi:hypothetical protein
MNSIILLLLYILLFALQIILLILCVKEEKGGKWKGLFSTEIFSILISIYHCYTYEPCIIGIHKNCIPHYIFYYFVITSFISLLGITLLWHKIIFTKEEP